MEKNITSESIVQKEVHPVEERPNRPEKVRAGISFEAEIIEALDQYAERVSINRSEAKVPKK